MRRDLAQRRHARCSEFGQHTQPRSSPSTPRTESMPERRPDHREKQSPQTPGRLGAEPPTPATAQLARPSAQRVIERHCLIGHGSCLNLVSLMDANSAPTRTVLDGAILFKNPSHFLITRADWRHSTRGPEPARGRLSVLVLSSAEHWSLSSSLASSARRRL